MVRTADRWQRKWMDEAVDVVYVQNESGCAVSTHLVLTIGMCSTVMYTTFANATMQTDLMDDARVDERMQDKVVQRRAGSFLLNNTRHKTQT